MMYCLVPIPNIPKILPACINTALKSRLREEKRQINEMHKPIFLRIFTYFSTGFFIK